ncbi:hypothetical protein DXU93_05250 [Brumimicrobium aurantiacum]|uniref:Uncharacterized protein n=2 Tax=Brumimicrobium aurantiacum TaxID=1737063 RepID=A0A3E1F076_9FLAO|nr:hypothetical protein DXU93_05250 [Brumimicrobium aurantiacum]
MFSLLFSTGLIHGQEPINEEKLEFKKLEQLTNSTYKLYHTSNEMGKWVYLKLNTANGMLTQLVIDEKNNLSYENNINTLPLVEKSNQINDRFVLKSTPNNYTFILLDQINGRMWKVYWSLETEEREIISIP